MRTVLIALSVLGLALAPTASHAQPAACIIETLAGGEDTPSGDGGPALAAELVPTDIAHGPDGALYIADFGHWSIRRIRLDGVIERVAGTGKGGHSPDGTPALAAAIQPRYLAFDSSGDLLFTDRGQVRKISGGVVTTVAGNGSSDFSGDGDPAVDAGIGSSPIIAAEPDGSILVAQDNHFRIRRITPNGIIETIAGTGANAASGDGGPAVTADIGSPRALVVASDGSIYFWAGVSGPNRPGVRRIRPDGVIESHSPYFRSISDLKFDSNGALFAVASGVYRYAGNDWLVKADIRARAISVSANDELFALVSSDHQVFRLGPDDPILVAGLGPESPHGEGGLASLAYVAQATGVSVAQDSSVYYADPALGRIRRITSTGTMERVDLDSAFNLSGVSRISVGPDGVVYAPVRRPAVENPSLLAIAVDGTVSSIPFVYDPFPGRPTFDELNDIEVDEDGNVIVSFEKDGNFFEVLGSPSSRTSVERLSVNQFAVAPDGRMFVGALLGRWFWLSLDGQTEPIAGLTGFVGEPGPSSVAVGPDGSLYWSSQSAIWRMLPNQNIDQIAGSVETGYGSQGSSAKDALFNRIEDMTIGPNGHLYVADYDRIHRISSPDECPSAGARPKIAFQGVVNGADYRRISPGAVFSLFGTNVGPDELAGAVLGQDGKLPTQLGGTRVLFNGVPAPLIFASSGQVNGIIPFETHATIRQEGSSTVSLSGEPVHVVVEKDGKSSTETPLLVWESWPAIFTLDSSGSGPGAFLDANDALIDPGNPATPGSVIVMWATGAGLTDPIQESGTINNGPALPKPVLPLTVEIGGLPATIEYAGAAPGLAAGIIQINVRVPAALTQTGDVPVRLFNAQPESLVGPVPPTVYVE